MGAFSQKRFLASLVVTCILFFGAGFLTLKHLQKVVPERVAARLALSGTEGLGFDKRVVGDELGGPLRSLFVLWAINQALDTYPPTFLKVYGPNILLTNKLTIMDHPASGTWTVQKPQKGWVIVASYYIMFEARDLESIRRTFHHEFSSVLMDAVPFPHEEWETALSEGFAFPHWIDQEMFNSVRDYPSAAEMPAIYARGFVDGYGRSNQENDINTYAELLLDAPDELAALAARYPAIAKKAAIISRFYQSLDPGFKTQRFTNQASRPSPSALEP